MKGKGRNNTAARDHDGSHKEVLVGAVSSSFRFNPFTHKPHHVSKAHGCRITDSSGKEFIDFFMGNGAALLGHDRPEIMDAIRRTVELGFVAEFDCELNLTLARRIAELIPSAEGVRFTNSGSESTALAMRLARGFTGRDLIVRLDGHFHGNHDYVLFNNLAAYRDRENKGGKESAHVLFSAGVPKSTRESVVVIPWQDLEALEHAIHKFGDRLAGIILNPVDYNNGCITADREYLSQVNEMCHENGMVVIYDEILSGFRTGVTCAQGYYGVTPDLTTLGKVLSNGVPLSAVGGREDIMYSIMREKYPVISGGTFSGNLLGVSAAHAALSILSADGFYDEYLARCDGFFRRLQSTLDEAGLPASVQWLGAGFYIYVGTRNKVDNYSDMDAVDKGLAERFFRACIDRGVYFHTDFTVSAAHDEASLSDALDRIGDAAQSVMK